MKMSQMSHVSATIPWQEGTEDDFKELREGLEKMKQGGTFVHTNDDSNDEDDSDEDIPSYHKFALNNDDHEEETSEEDDVDPGDENPGERLLWAAQHNHLDIATKLLDKDSSLISYKDSDEYTALHRAAYSHHQKMLEFLLDRGGDPLALTEGGWTPLHSAARWNSFTCVETLLRLTPVNTRTAGGQTPLHLASQSHNRETLELLLSHPEIDPSIVNNQDPMKVRYSTKYDHSAGCLVVKMTDDVHCLQYKTDLAMDVKKMDKFVNNLMRHMASKEQH